MAPSRLKLYVAFATLYLVWGSTYLGIRIAVSSMPPFLMASLRFLVAGTVMLAFLRLRGPLGFKPRHYRDNAISGAFLLVGGNGLVSWAEQYIPSGVTALIVGSQPLMMVLVDWFSGGTTRPRAAMFAALALGFAGVAWLSAPWEQGAGHSSPVAALAVVAACVLWACGSIFGKRARDPAPPLAGAGLQMLLGGALLALVAAGRGEWSSWHPSQVTGAAWGAFAYLTTVGSLVGFSTFIWLMKHSTPARVSTYAYVNPIVAVILGWLILGEPVGARITVCSAAIIASVLLISLQRSSSRA